MYYEIVGISNVLCQTWKWAGGLILWPHLTWQLKTVKSAQQHGNN
jgi:hypothetical protein